MDNQTLTKKLAQQEYNTANCYTSAQNGFITGFLKAKESTNY